MNRATETHSRPAALQRIATVAGFWALAAACSGSDVTPAGTATDAAGSSGVGAAVACGAGTRLEDGQCVANANPGTGAGGATAGASGNGPATAAGSPGAITCGPGTRLDGNECVADTNPGTGAGGATAGASGSGPAATAGGPGAITCGPGTRLEGNECVVDTNPGTGAGGATAGASGSGPAATGGGPGAITCGPGTRLEGRECVVDTNLGTGGDGSGGSGSTGGSGGGTGGADPGGAGGVLPCVAGTGGGACVQLLAENQALPYAVAVDATHVYWINWGTRDSLRNYNHDGAVLRVPVDGGPVVALASGEEAPRWMAIDETHVYWTSYVAQGEVLRVAKAGGDPETVSVAQEYPTQIVVAGDYVYWVDQGDYGAGNDAIVRSSVDGSDSVVWVPDQTEIRGLAVAAGELFWGSASGIQKRPLDGASDPVVLVDYPDSEGPLGADASAVYWTENYCPPNELRTIPSAGGELLNLALEPGCNPMDLVVDDDHVYWLVGNTCEDPGPDCDPWYSAAVLKTPIQPGLTTVLAEGQDIAIGIAVDDAHVYWVSQNGNDEAAEGTVRRAPK